MQSSGAHARQMDADFDDNSMANNDGLGVHPHHFNSAEAQICEAQAQQQPTRPNVGTHMLNNQRRRQERNMYLAVRPPPPPTANLLHLHSAVRSIQHGTRKDNTKKAYDRKTQEYREFVHCKFSFQDPYRREVVEHEKVYSFMFYCCFRENKVGKKAPKKPKNAPVFDEQEYDQVLARFHNQPRDGPRLEPKHGLKASAIEQYKCAIKQLHQLQQDEQRNTIPWEQIWTLKCTELHNMVKQRRNRQDRANCVEKIDHDTPYETKEHINKMEKSFWMEGMNVPSQTVFRSLRDRFCFLMTVNAILRGESLFMAELSDLYGIGWIGDDGYDHNPFWILMLQMRTGKTNGSNLKLYGRAGRHKDPTMCPMGALAFYLFYRFHKTKEMDPPPNFCESSSWFSMKLLVDYNGGKSRDYFTSISDESYRSVVKAHLEKNNIHSSHLVHIGRKWGSYLAQLQGDDWEDVRILGNWDPNTQDKSYSIKIPVKQVRSMAGWRRADQFHYNVRAEVVPPEDLRHRAMEDEQQQQQQQQQEDIIIESPLSREENPKTDAQQRSMDPEPSPPFPSTASLVETQVFYPPTRSIGSGANTLRYTCHSPAWHCAFSTSGEWLAACFGAPNPCIRLWRYQEGADLPPVPATSTKSDKQHQQHSKHKDNEHRRRRPPPPHCCDPDDFHSDTSSSWIMHSTLEGIHQRTIRCVAFCPLAKTCILAAASFDATVTLWQYDPQKDEWECTTQLEGHENEVKYVSWNATGSLLATCGRDKTVWIWETFLDGTIGGSSDNEFDCIAVLNGHEGDVKCVKFAPSHNIWGDGDEILISASYDNTIKIWAEDAGDWYCAASISDVHQDTIWSLALSPGGGRLVTASADGSLGILKSYTPKERTEKFPDLSESTNGLWKCVGTLDNAHSSTVYGLDYAPARAGHGRIASSGGDNRIQIYREVRASTSDKPLFDLDVAVETSHGDVNCVCWHPRDGSILCSAGDDGTVRLWRFDP